MAQFTYDEVQVLEEFHTEVVDHIKSRLGFHLGGGQTTDQEDQVIAEDIYAVLMGSRFLALPERPNLAGAGIPVKVPGGF